MYVGTGQVYLPLGEAVLAVLIKIKLRFGNAAINIGATVTVIKLFFSLFVVACIPGSKLACSSSEIFYRPGMTGLTDLYHNATYTS